MWKCRSSNSLRKQILRQLKKCKIEVVAKELGLSRQRIYHILKKKYFMLEDAKRFEKLLNIRISYIIEREE
jgi:Helix-turn-helix.